MGISFFISVLTLFIWSNVAIRPVQCQSSSGILDESKLTGQILVGLCLRKCGFQPFKAKISREELSLDPFCYAKCVGNEGKHHSSVNERNRLVNLRNTSSFERVKRDALTSAKNQTSLNTSEWLQKCLMNKDRVRKSFTTSDVKVTYKELNNTGRYTATLSWKPFDIELSNWTGYGIIYAILNPSNRHVHGLCQELDKSATNFTITNSSYGLIRGSSIAHYITSLPYPVEIPFYFLFACKVPTPCHTFPDQPTIRTGFATQFTAQRRVKFTGGDNEGVPNMAAAISSTCAFVLLVLLLLSTSTVNLIA